MADFPARVRRGKWKSHLGKPIPNIINFSIGGSELANVLAQRIILEVESRSASRLTYGSSTNSMIRRHRRFRETSS